MADEIERFLKTRDPALVEPVVTALSTDIFLYVSNRGYSMEDAKDMRQDVMLDIVKGIFSCRAKDRPQFFAWCYAIARHRIARFLRERKRQPQPHPDFDALRERADTYAASQPSLENEKSKLREAIEILRRLGGDCYELVVSRHFFGLGLKEVGENFGISEDAARMRINRCLEKALKG
jgi:RNA polymerase sigma factor (sigma-70 family)